ncbi:hypothetical protein [Streptomyces lydicamycinicus]|uniref:hypothetical protein n=1 Tax=Streptomyces lydicamycinicus TaxID=1546107 RepID=UPI003C2D5DAE
MIRPGQVYEACSPNIRGPRLVRVISYEPGASTVTVINHETATRQQELPVAYFHPDRYTKAGHHRRTGYALKEPAD